MRGQCFGAACLFRVKIDLLSVQLKEESSVKPHVIVSEGAVKAPAAVWQLPVSNQSRLCTLSFISWVSLPGPTSYFFASFFFLSAFYLLLSLSNFSVYPFILQSMSNGV